MIDVIVAGHLCVDIIPQIPPIADPSNFLAPGRLTETGGMVLAMGGAVSNTGLALHRLGMNVRLVARLGQDRIADLTREILRSQGEHLADYLTVGEGEPSSYTIVINPPGFDRTFLHCPGPNHTFGPEDISDDLLDQSRLFHLGYPPLMRRMYSDGGETLAAIYRRAKSRGVTTSLDVSMPDPAQASGKADWHAILAATLPHVDIFVPSAEELMYMLWRERYDALNRSVGAANMLDVLGPDDLTSLADLTLALGSRILIIKLGHRGLYLRTAPTITDMGRGAPIQLDDWVGREAWLPCFRVQVVGTVGAGDCTIAGFLAGILRGQGPIAAAISATAVGACNVEAADATSGVRSWEQTQMRIKEGWERAMIKLDAPGWRWDPSVSAFLGPRNGR